MIQVTVNGVIEDEESKMIGRTVQAIDNLIDNSLYIRKHASKIIPDYLLLKDFCTIKIQGCRKTGHTSAIKIVSSRFKNPVVVVPLLVMITHPSNLLTFQLDALDSMRGFIIDAVFVDLASIIDKKKEKDILFLCTEFLAKDPNFCLIMLS